MENTTFGKIIQHLSSSDNIKKMSESNESESSQSTDSDYIPSQTPESEDYTSYESSEPLTPTDSGYSSLE